MCVCVCVCVCVCTNSGTLAGEVRPAAHHLLDAATKLPEAIDVVLPAPHGAFIVLAYEPTGAARGVLTVALALLLPIGVVPVQSVTSGRSEATLLKHLLLTSTLTNSLPVTAAGYIKDSWITATLSMQDCQLVT